MPGRTGGLPVIPASEVCNRFPRARELAILAVLASSGFDWETFPQWTKWKREGRWFLTNPTSTSGLHTHVHTHTCVFMHTRVPKHIQMYIYTRALRTHIYTHENEKKKCVAGDSWVKPMYNFDFLNTLQNLAAVKQGIYQLSCLGFGSYWVKAGATTASSIHTSNTASFAVPSKPGCEFQMERIICYCCNCSIFSAFL